jgi:hypothetical protein
MKKNLQHHFIGVTHCRQPPPSQPGHQTPRSRLLLQPRALPRQPELGEEQIVGSGWTGNGGEVWQRMYGRPSVVVVVASDGGGEGILLGAVSRRWRLERLRIAWRRPGGGWEVNDHTLAGTQELFLLEPDK